MRRTVFALALLLSVALIAPAAELVVNGGFETGDFTGWTVAGNLGYTSVESWPLFAYDGYYGAALGPVGSDGVLSQILPTIAGGTYTLSYALENVPDQIVGGATPNDFGVYWGGVLVPGSGFLDSPPFTGQVFTFTVTAPGPNTQLQFFYREDPGFWGLDNVSVQGAAVPEPASLGLAGLGLLAAFGVRRFRK